MCKKRSFTLIELLIVVSIIIILVGIAVPVYLVASKKARAGQAKFQIKALQTAIVGYKSQYQYLPFFPANGSTFNDLLVNEDSPAGVSGDGYNDLIATLRGTNAILNPRQIEYLAREGTTYTDPWGQSFYVALDLKGDGEINDSTGDPKVYGASVVTADVAIWSKGPDREHSSTDDDSLNDDNITSW